MNNFKLFLTLTFLLFTALLFCAKVHISELTPIDGMHYIPDMAGYVNIKDSSAPQVNILPNRTLPQVMPGFPLSYANSNTYNGAVYTNMDTDPELEILFGVGKKIVALNPDGTTVPGWPVTMTFYIWGSPAIGDIDGDGNAEIVGTSRNNTNGNTGALYAYHIDGSVVTGFPVTQAGGGTMNVCLANVAGDTALEILVNVRNSPNGWTYVFTGNGQVLEGWPQQLNTFPGAGISAGDINNDGNVEIIALSYTSLFAFNNDGSILPGFPVSFPGINYSYSSPVLVDLDGDATKEIVYGGCSSSAGAVYVINNDGTTRAGWPKTTSSWIFATVSIGDLDGNGEMDILVGDQVSSNDPANYIYAWDKDGNAIQGFPVGPVYAIYTQAAIADIDGDASTDIIISSNLFGGGYNCFNSDGTHKAEWPMPVGTDATAVTMMTTPVVGDFNLDGNLEIAGASTGFSSWLVELYLWSTGVAYNADLAYMTLNGCNIRHDGVYLHETAQEQLLPPTNLSSTVTEDNVTLDWSLPEPSNRDLLGFNVYRDTLLLTISPLPDTAMNFTDSHVLPGTYTYNVTAVYTGGESVPASVTATIIPIVISVFPWVEEFQNSFPPAFWMNVDQDNDGYSWQQAGTDNYYIKSAAFADSTQLTPDNWLITPKINIPTSPLEIFQVLTYKVRQETFSGIGQDYSIMVSTTDTNISSFSTLGSENINEAEWTYRYLALGDYYNQEIYVAFRHHNNAVTSSALLIDSVSIITCVGNSENNVSTSQTNLGKNYPNPFNPSTRIDFNINKTSPVTLEIYNIKGQKVCTLLNEVKSSGRHSVTWNGKDDSQKNIGSGVYFYKMTTPDYSAIHKMILLK